MKDEILDKFAARVVLLAGFAFVVLLLGLYILLWLKDPLFAVFATALPVVFWAFGRVIERGIKLSRAWK